MKIKSTPLKATEYGFEDSVELSIIEYLTKRKYPSRLGISVPIWDEYDGRSYYHDIEVDLEKLTEALVKLKETK
jgi:hypothetical protein